MYLSTFFLPLFGFLAATGLGRYIGGRGAAAVTTFLVGLAFLQSCCILYEVGFSQCMCSLQAASWFSSELFQASWGFLFDPLTAVMLCVVTSVSLMVHIYSQSYMGEDPHLPRFMGYLSFFTFCMLMLVTSDNFVQMFLGWEGVGVASYLLINFWYTRLQANKSAIKALLMNRVGDVGFALGIFGVFSLFQSVDLATVFATAGHLYGTSFLFFGYECDALSVLCILLFIGAVGKSAQLGLHTWLPDAMEGPTPVSALIHAATMVTAGVFLVARCSPMFEYAPEALSVVACCGGMTAFFAATTGLFQNDMKRVIAYSTCSQLGYMIFACGLSAYSVGVFHLANHAFFKALLFLSAGSVIHALSDEQDMRKMGGLNQALPWTYTMMVLGSLALVGFPFLTGFYSKDVILEVAAAQYTICGRFTHILGSMCVFFTSYYSFRLLFVAFLGPVSGEKSAYKTIHDAPLLMALPLAFLCVGSIFVGYVGKDAFIGAGSTFWGQALFVLPDHSRLLEAEYIDTQTKLLPLGFTFAGAVVAYILTLGLPSFSYVQALNPLVRPFIEFFSYRWMFDGVFNAFARQSLAFGYHVSFKTLDKGLFEIFGPFGLVSLLSSQVKLVRAFHSGFVYHAAFCMVVGLVGIAAVGLGFPFSFDQGFFDAGHLAGSVRLAVVLCMSALFVPFFA